MSLASSPEMFMAYNNGISTVADSIVIDEASSHDDLVTITEITGWQIVNGGQTTASIYNAFQAKLPLEKVHVQIKLVSFFTRAQISKKCEEAPRVSGYSAA